MCCRARKSCYERCDLGLRRGKCAVGGTSAAKVGRDAGTCEHCRGIGWRERDCLAGPGTLCGADPRVGRARDAGTVGGSVVARESVSWDLPRLAVAVSIERRSAGFGGAWNLAGENLRFAR